MNQETYLKERVDDQINWLSNKSGWNQKRYKRIRISILLLSVFIPFAAGMVSDDKAWLKLAIGVAGVLIAIGEGMVQLHKYQELWVKYRATAESLKREKNLFLTKAGPYAETTDLFPLFVERIELILGAENADWQQYISEKKSQKSN